jgi:hypothetical protein
MPAIFDGSVINKELPCRNKPRLKCQYAEQLIDVQRLSGANLLDKTAIA